MAQQSTAYPHWYVMAGPYDVSALATRRTIMYAIGPLVSRLESNLEAAAARHHQQGLGDPGSENKQGV
jgi:hypothetical protein